MPGAGLISTIQAFLAGPVAILLCVFGCIKVGGAMMSGENRGHYGAGAALIGMAIALWALRWVTFVQSQS